ncbi:flagellar motor protein MotB [Rhizosaccharibacter radicis]|uniref:OmpA family protein n=1 Tax=Rhizosaccharibacter radicis TaxID=2782605 RepID=A0ABT1VUA6_9PROT|nr:OmpA family protein [Acetobacteraceae bacterium KSS12]
MAKKRGKDAASIVIRREEEGEHGHHGGAWKVAYADFVTAMMAFFLLMWLLNATTEQQRRGIAAYFSPLANVDNGFSGAGMVPGGISPAENGINLAMKGQGTPPPGTPPAAPAATQPFFNEQGGRPDQDPDDDSPAGKGGPSDGDAQAPAATATGQAAAATTQGVGQVAATDAVASGPGASPVASASLPRPSSPQAAQAGGTDGSSGGGAVPRSATEERKLLADTANQLQAAVAADPVLAASSDQMTIDLTPGSLRIQIVDSERKPMFARGSVKLDPRAVGLFKAVAPVLARLGEPLSIAGYTDAAPVPAGLPSNWSLSAGRAAAARDVMAAAGLPDGRLQDVTGFADRHLLLPADPLASANRRVVLVVHRLHPDPARTAATDRAGTMPPAIAPPVAAPSTVTPVSASGG